MSFLAIATGLNFFCGIPGVTFIGPILAAINPINPINWIIYLILLAVLYYAPAVGSTFNTVNGAKSFGRAALWALLFYFIITYFLYLILILTICKGTASIARSSTVVSRAMKE